MTTDIALIGCGVIGQRRAQNLPADAQLVACYDTNPQRADQIAQLTGAIPCESLEKLFAYKPRAAMIATINSSLTDLAQQSLNSGLDILVEKPAARSYDELSRVQVPPGRIFKVGFNHRFHPAYDDLLKELASNPDDRIMYICAKYGNGARLGFDKEWRTSPTLAGGGELLDQGVHVIDLAQNILGNLTVHSALVRTLFWDMPVEDNAWAICSAAKDANSTQKNTKRKDRDPTFAFHVSATEWKNEFRFEVHATSRKYVWSGLGRSYGPETLTIYKMKPEMGPPDVVTQTYGDKDISWFAENSNFINAINKKEEPIGTITDALASLRVVRDVYNLSDIALQRASLPLPKRFGSDSQ